MSPDDRAAPGGEALSARTAVVWSVLHAELARRPQAQLSIVDIGGGTGGFAVPLAQLGHAVTVVDPSPDALATLDRRARTSQVSDRIHAVQGDTDTLVDLVAADSADLVLCHSLLEVVDDPELTLRLAAAVLRGGGALSVLVANRAAAVLSRALGGHFADAERALVDPDGRWGDGDGSTRRFDSARLVTMLETVGLAVQLVHGVRVVADLVPGAVADGAGESLVGVELALAAVAPYRDIATQLHVLARKA
ncbi:MAG: methyltransferase domain-containing protein [Geodermatophilaceae bacterium]|nr:methyltransferase domain-containing protein [Geodermatophilaceae bacterium]